MEEYSETVGEKDPWGSVRVAVRVRPFVAGERMDGSLPCVNFTYNNPTEIIMGQKSFTFDFVFKPASSQENVFENCVEPLVERFVQGYNATILAYGQTGSGKTYTMGTTSTNLVENEVGIIPRVIQTLFKKFDHSHSSMKVSFLEIHLEEIRDLLNPSSELSKPLSIRDNGDGEVRIEGLTEKEVSSPEELLGYLDEGSIYRSTASTRMNAQSSRSHAVFTVYLEQTRIINPEGDPTDPENTEILSSKFHFVDLAGSERVKKTQASGDRLKEGININSGLLALGKVISRLVDRKGHVPFRDSKITRLLQDSLGGNSQTLMIACVSPSETNMVESLSTLRYACRARNIKNTPVVNRDQNSEKLMQMQEYIKSLEEALRGKGIPLENDHLSSEELRRAQAEKDMLENEVQRLMMENSELKKDISKKSEMLKQTKFEKEATVVQMQRLVEGANISSDLLNELNISERDLEKVKSEREEIALLKKSIEESGKEISLLRAKISGYQQSPLKFTRPKRSLPSVAEDSEQEFAFDEGHDVAHHVADDEFAEEECDDFHPSVLDFALEEDEGAELKKLLKEKAETEQDYEYNQSQFESHMRNLDLELKSKQDLITALVQTREEAKNLKKNYEKKISDLELEIERIQDQKDIIATKMLSSQADDLIQLEADKAKYEHKLKTMKDQLSSFQDKLKESERRARVQKQEESQIRNLQMEINNIKNQKVRLQKKMKEDADKHREWRESIERQLKALNKKERMNEIEISRMRARAAQADLVVKRKNEENAALQRKLRSTLHGAAEQKVTLNPSNLRRLRHGIISEVENITKLWSLCEELDKNCDTKESLLAEIESLKSKLSKKPEDADLIEDQMESVEGQLQYVNSKIQEVEAELEALALPIPRVLSAEHFKTDRKFFLKYPLNHIEEAKEIILYLINRLIPAVKVRDTLKQANEQLEMELHQVKRELKNREISFSTMEAAFRRNADKREIQLIQKYNESIRDIPDLLIGEDATVDLSNVTLDMGDAGRDEKLKHYYRYTETWRNKIVQKGAENRPIETTRISSLKSKVMSQEARAVSNPRRVKN